MRSEARSETERENVWLEVVPGAAQLRHAELPGGQRLPHARELVAEVTLGQSRRDALAVLGGEHVDAELPALARLERDPVANRAALDRPAAADRMTWVLPVEVAERR